MKVVALRGVCVGVDRHLKPGDTAEIDDAQFPFLSGIGAVAKAAEPEPETPKTEAPVKAGKKES
jgi:hypothetical protein